MAWFAAALGIGVIATLVVTSAWSADAAPGDDDATYVPWPGCRLTDTRADSQIGPRGTTLGADEVMTVEVHGDHGECTGPLAIPGDAVGLATNVTVVDATAQSNIRVYRGDLTEPPLLSNLNVTPGASPTPNKVDTQLAPDGTLNVYNFKGTVNVVIDVVGYYTSDSLKALSSQPGQVGPPGPAGAQGDRGFSAWDVIPSGVTVTGNFSYDDQHARENENGDFVRAVALPGVAPVPLTDDKVNFAADPKVSDPDADASCTGTPAAPTAPAGTVCLYLLDGENVDAVSGFADYATDQLTDRGFQVAWVGDGLNGVGADTFVYATWAYTAP
ncbi:MAG: hypothetical protein AAFY28_18425 [Actinomycetota bacterium]